MTKEQDEQKMVDAIYKTLSPLDLLKDPNRQILELELKKRKICAKEWGRILPDEKPDFIGNFYSCGFEYGDSLEGIFEMFIEKDGNNFKGKIEDCLGTATIEGEILPDKIIFTKKYIEEKSTQLCLKGDIRYEGYLVENSRGNYYMGEWSSFDQKTEGHFDLNAIIL